MINLNYGQTFNDTIVTSSTDTIFCKITLVNEFNLFYDYNPKRKIIKTAHIERETVLFFSVSDTSVYIMEKQTPPTPIERERYSYKEENGIIYHNTYSTPPIYGNGLPNLNDFITKNVRVYPSDTREFRGQIVTVLFSVAIDSLGYVIDVDTHIEASTGTNYYDSRHLESELCRVIKATNRWRPALVNNIPVSSIIYLPIKFQIDINRLFLLPSRNTFSLKNRE
jgi:hypothetical protein